MIEILLTVPPTLAATLNRGLRRAPSWLARLRGSGDRPAFVGADPAGERLGSGGGTVNLLFEAWRAARAERRALALTTWLSSSQKLVVHAGGESRRLPAYAALGKAFMPLPGLDGLHPRLHDQVLADFQLPSYAETLVEAGPRAAALVTSGDVWLDFDATDIPVVESDIVGIGMRVSPEVAQHFGVFFVKRDPKAKGIGERPIAFFRQKPSPSEIAGHLARYDAFVDTGMWLLSAAALSALFRRCGFDEREGRFETRSGHARFLDLYGEVGCSLGAEAEQPRALKAAGFGRLTSGVVPLETARFYHLGSSRQLLESLVQLQWRSLTPRRSFAIGAAGGPFVTAERDPTFTEGSSASEPVKLEGLNLLTGLPPGARVSRLGPGTCLDVAPVRGGAFVVRPYHLDDACRGLPGEAVICGQPAADWLARRGFKVTARDVYDLPIYPVVAASSVTQELVDWFFAPAPAAEVTAELAHRSRLSAAAIPQAFDFERYFSQRRLQLAESLRAAFEACARSGEAGPFEQDFAGLAEFCRREAPTLGRWLVRASGRIRASLTRPEHQSRFAMLLAGLTRGTTRAAWSREGFARLQSAMISTSQLAKASPRLALKEDNIVWGRSPVRLDLAGGWTDTPPFCLEAGGTVLNVAVLLNGQPPIQVFVRPTAELLLRLRSIDQGSAESVASYEDLARFRNPREPFSLPKAALALAGFHPEFVAGSPFPSLRSQLRAFGSGLEISLLSAIPKGSGLGTSSILAATLLGAVSRACGLGWDEFALYDRVLGVEQLLTTGGGWQDQAGALFPGLKLVETKPGPNQVPTVRYLPERIVADAVNRSLLLYYTGLTRVAKGILQEIVRDMFLGRARTVRTLEALRANAWRLYSAVQLGDVATFERCIARSWRLNKALDAGTSTPEIESIVDACGIDLAACKLLGAGGGGYMLLCARDAVAGARIREKLEASPPNRRARFIDFSVATHGLQVTVS